MRWKGVEREFVIDVRYHASHFVGLEGTTLVTKEAESDNPRDSPLSSHDVCDRTLRMRSYQRNLFRCRMFGSRNGSRLIPRCHEDVRDSPCDLLECVARLLSGFYL